MADENIELLKIKLKLRQALKVGCEMRKRQKEFFASKGKNRQALIDSKRLEAAFDYRLSELGYN